MSDTLLGVIIGGLIASIAPLFNLVMEQKKTRRAERLMFLKEKRAQLNQAFSEAEEKLNASLDRDEFEPNMVFDFMRLFPKNVYEAFDAMMLEKDRRPEKLRHHYHEIVSAMKTALAEVDSQIERLVR